MLISIVILGAGLTLAFIVWCLRTRRARRINSLDWPQTDNPDSFTRYCLAYFRNNGWDAQQGRRQNRIVIKSSGLNILIQCVIKDLFIIGAIQEFQKLRSDSPNVRCFILAPDNAIRRARAETIDAAAKASVPLLRPSELANLAELSRNKQMPDSKALKKRVENGS